MEKDTLRMQFLSGVITEGQYKIKLHENENEEIAAKIEPTLNKPEVEKKIEDIYFKLSDEEKIKLRSTLNNLGIDSSTSSKEAHDAVQKVADNIGGGMSEGDENISPKEKTARILHGIGAANVAAFGGVPAAILIGGLLAGTVGAPMIAGFAISWGATALLMGLAKLLEKEPGSSNESLNESMIGGIVGIGAINQIPPRAKADYETAFEHFLGEKYGLNEVEIEEGNLGHGENYSIEPEGGFWVVTYKTIEGKKEKIFQSKEDAEDFVKFGINMEEGKEVEKPTNY